MATQYGYDLSSAGQTLRLVVMISTFLSVRQINLDLGEAMRNLLFRVTHDQIITVATVVTPDTARKAARFSFASRAKKIRTVRLANGRSWAIYQYEAGVKIRRKTMKLIGGGVFALICPGVSYE